MPIVEVEIVLKPGEAISSEMAPELADQLGEIFDSPRNATWVKVLGVPEFQYAENGGKEDGVYPVFVHLLKSRLPDPEAMQREVELITGAVAQICNRASSFVHVIYEPEARGRVAFGGKIVK